MVTQILEENKSKYLYNLGDENLSMTQGRNQKEDQWICQQKVQGGRNTVSCKMRKCIFTNKKDFYKKRNANIP